MNRTSQTLPDYLRFGPIQPGEDVVARLEKQEALMQAAMERLNKLPVWRGQAMVIYPTSLERKS